MRLPFSYSWRNVRARPLRSALTASVIALVVLACTLLLGLITSMRRTFTSTGHPLNLVVLRKGSDNDGSSMLPVESYQAIRFLDGIARNGDDQPLVSPEVVVQPFFRTREGGRENVLVRGVEPVALEVHDQVRVTEGRMFRPSSGEAIVGRGVTGRYQGAELGGAIEFGRGKWKVVGLFDAEGTSFESEVWVDVRELANDAKRPLPFSGFRVRTANVAERERIERRIDDDPRWALDAEPEIDYYAELASTGTTLYVIVVAVAVLAGIGASFGAANTMYAAVQTRTAEIGTLRALGFPRGAILWAFQAEAVVLALIGFAIGAVASVAAAWILSNALGGFAVGAATFTTSVVVLEVDARSLAAALFLAIAIGIAAGLGPAWRAARLRPIEALRKA
ncbi:MAG: ABC transporter permease [Deltaproteobacteria bacterium]|nr:ABC transporter permease [Deltaproteobacteria bacterium]